MRAKVIILANPYTYMFLKSKTHSAMVQRYCKYKFHICPHHDIVLLEDNPCCEDCQWDEEVSSYRTRSQHLSTRTRVGGPSDLVHQNTIFLCYLGFEILKSKYQ